MTKTYTLENLDCGNCAAKIERNIQKIIGVNEATVTFMTKKLVVDANDDNYDDIFNQIDKAVHKVDRGIEIKEIRRR